MENDYSIFDGFMPMIKNITLSSSTNSLSSNGELIAVHCVTVRTVEGAEFVFSIAPYDLHRLSILIMKTLITEV